MRTADSCVITQRRSTSSTDWFEPLETRALFSPAPIPSLDSLSNPANPVIRLTTTFGDIDIEMFDHLMPGLVAEYIEGLDRGTTCDHTFFHRSQSGILQGGLYTFAQGNDVGAVPACSPLLEPIHGGAGLANLERTVATGALGDAFSFLGPFIFNLQDNSLTLDPDQTVVFGRVLDDRSWAVVQTISALPVANLTGDASFAGTFAGSFTSTPITRPFNPGDDEEPSDLVEPDLLVQNTDLSILKPIGAPDFYRSTLYMPEGYLSSFIREFVPIENPNDEPIWFELTARYEERPNRLNPLRDDLVLAGMIPARSRGGVTLEVGDRRAPSKINRADQPYSLELRTTRPVTASLSHYDFNSAIALPFTEQTATEWVFPEISLGNEGERDFLVWYNPSHDDADITVTLTTSEGLTLDPIVFTTEGLRRGGLSLAGFPPGHAFARVTSSVPIVASRSHYSSAAGGSGHAEYGGVGAGSTVGVIPVAIPPFRFGLFSAAGAFIELSILNNGEQAVTVSVSVLSSGSSTPVAAGFAPEYTIAPGTSLRVRGEYIPDAEAHTLVYNATGPVHASYIGHRFDRIGGGVSTLAATEQHFAEGFTDPSRTTTPNGTLFESLHLFNPFGAPLGISEQTANVRLTFRYADGFEFSLDRSISGGVGSWLNISGLNEIRAQADEHQRYFYSIQIQSDLPIVSQLLHLDLGTGLSTSPFGGAFALAGYAFGMTTRLDDLIPG